LMESTDEQRARQGSSWSHHSPPKKRKLVISGPLEGTQLCTLTTVCPKNAHSSNEVSNAWPFYGESRSDEFGVRMLRVLGWCACGGRWKHTWSSTCEDCSSPHGFKDEKSRSTPPFSPHRTKVWLTYSQASKRTSEWIKAIQSTNEGRRRGGKGRDAERREI